MSGSRSGAAARPVSDVVVAGHVSLDVFPTLYGPVKIEPGRLVVVGPAVLSTGGVVANTGVALHRLGVRVGLCAKVGDDVFGRAVLESLAQHGEHLVAGIEVCAAEPTSYTIVITPPGEDRSFLHCPGANQTFGAEDIPYDDLAGARLFHFGYPPLMPRMYADDGAQLRVKLGAGAGLNPHFGAPEWRIVFGVELFDHSTDRDKDGVTDSKDACPDTPGVKTKDPKTNGCPVNRGSDGAPKGPQDQDSPAEPRDPNGPPT